MIEELRAWVERSRGPRQSGRSAAMFDDALAKRGQVGQVFIVSVGSLEEENLGAEFMEHAKRKGLTGIARRRFREVEVEETRFRFIGLGEDGTVRGISAPRFVDHQALTFGVARLVRSETDSGPL